MSTKPEQVKINEWLDCLNTAISLQKEIFTVSEDQFNSISHDLQRFYKSSKDITSAAQDITRLLTFQEYQNDLNSLNNSFAAICRFFEQAHGKFTLSETSLGKIAKLLKNSVEAVNGFNKICRHLEMQSISIKIESSRLGNDDKGFRNLADDIHKLSELISTQSNGFRDKAKLILNLTANVQNQVFGIIRNQENNSKAVLKNTSHSLKLVSEEYELSNSKAASINIKSDNIVKSTGSLVTSVQFHDITRQQMQHVRDVLQDIITRLEAELSGGLTVKQEKELFSYIYNVTKLQAAQIQNSSSELLNAVNSIINSLQQLNKEIAGIASDILSLVNSRGQNGKSFVLTLKNDLDDIIRTLQSNDNLRQEFSASVDKVMTTIEQLSHFVNEINSIGTEIELLSLNANIKAAHTGEEGASLGVLAEAIQRLSSESNQHTNSVIEILMQTKKESDNLKQKDTEEEHRDEIFKYSDEIKRIFDTIAGAAGEASSEIEAINNSASVLKHDLDDSVYSLEKYSSMSHQLDKIIKLLFKISEECEPYADKTVSAGKMISSVGKSYTMKVQRDIHKTFSEKPESSPAGTVEAVNTSGEFGDNVELF